MKSINEDQRVNIAIKQRMWIYVSKDVKTKEKATLFAKKPRVCRSQLAIVAAVEQSTQKFKTRLLDTSIAANIWLRGETCYLPCVCLHCDLSFIVTLSLWSITHRFRLEHTQFSLNGFTKSSLTPHFKTALSTCTNVQCQERLTDVG